jgi:hypothetical protein
LLLAFRKLFWALFLYVHASFMVPILLGIVKVFSLL